MHNPPSYVSCATLAWELDVCESTVRDLVRRSVIPQPLTLSTGCVRWIWADVVVALAGLRPGSDTSGIDPFLAGARNAATQAQKGGRDAA
jgi:hypothetical protein